MADSEPGSGAVATAQSAAAEGPGEPAVKKSRGRPKKSDAQPAAEGRSTLRRRPVVAPEHYAPPPPNPSGKRGRGRPRKSEDAEPPVKKANSGQGKRGRPPKSVNSEAARPKGRPKGSKKKAKVQPAKAAEKEEEEEDLTEEGDAEEVEEKTEVMETPKKRGRPKKETPAVASETDNKVDADAPAEKTDDSAEEEQ